ncbi:hypothetical protein DMH27_04350 [Raoultella planticola]|nr:hypothetical protein [Raoultella planticola]
MAGKSYGVDALVVSRWNVVAMVCNGIGCLMVGALLNRGVRATWIGASGIVLTGIPALVILACKWGCGRHLLRRGSSPSARIAGGNVGAGSDRRSLS